MALDDCVCPLPAAIETIPAEDCGINLKQIQRIIIRRNPNSIGATAGNDINVLADMQALQTALDSTKMVITPLIGANPVIEPGEPITNGGGDNSTMNGVEEVTGVNPSKYSCEFKELSPAGEKAMKSLMCEKDLQAMFVLQGGKIAVKEIDGTNDSGFEIESFFVSDRGNQGFGTNDTHTMSFSLPSGWSEDLKIVKPTGYNPLTEL
jgi:hypothetical protein